MRTSFLPVLVVLLLAGCASPTLRTPDASSELAAAEARKQRELALRGHLDHERRLLLAAWPLLTANADFCEDRLRHTIGAGFWNIEVIAEDWREAARDAFRLSPTIQIKDVVPGSPAALAGLQKGDVVTALHGAPVGSGKSGLEAFGKQLREHLATGAALDITLARSGTPVHLSITPVRTCDFAPVVERSDTRNAYADGERLVLTTGMMDFFRNDQELALVVAHELAHNAMGHIAAKQQNAVTGGLAGLLLDVAAAAAGVNTQGAFTDLGAKAGAQTWSVEFEQEADYAGVYFMARAGYPIDGVADFWRRMAVMNPASIALKTSHPTAPERFVALENTVLEVKGKMAKGEPLVPEVKPEPVAATPDANTEDNDR